MEIGHPDHQEKKAHRASTPAIPTGLKVEFENSDVFLQIYAKIGPTEALPGVH